MRIVNWKRHGRTLSSMLLGAMLAFSPAPALAQEDAMKDYPGYVDFGQLNSIFGEPAVQIAVGKSLLNLVGALGGTDDDEKLDLFNRLHGVRVNVFSNNNMPDDAVDHVNAVSATLKKDGWESVVSVDSHDEQVRIFMKQNGDVVEGITLMAVESNEAAFINVIGDLNPEELRRIMDDFDVDFGDDHDHDDDDEKDRNDNDESA
jgi:hypothetical protein